MSTARLSCSPPLGRALLVLGLLAVAACGTDAAAPTEDTTPTPLDGNESDAADADLPDLPDPPDIRPDVDTTDITEPEDTRPDAADTDDVLPDAPPTDVSVDQGPPPSCTLATDCDDGLTCTRDTCTDGFCTWALVRETCLIGGQCFARNARDPDDTCRACLPDVDTFAYAPAPDETPCEAGDACVFDAVCTAGVCQGQPVTCEDGNACTQNLCDPVLGCQFPAEVDGTTCDDANACTTEEACLAGACVGEDAPCDDGNVCTTNTCVPASGCAVENNQEACPAPDACTVLTVCEDGSCGAGEPRNCDDGNACTIDLCDPFVGCVHLPDRNPCCEGTVSVCDDGNPCTTDLCDPELATCAYELNTANCDDGNACTVNDVCSAGTCGGQTRNCDDGNVCTLNQCNPSSGCVTSNNNGVACSDGVDCTLNDTCEAGRCVPEINTCTCEPTFGEAAVRFTVVQIGSGGRIGQGLDLDRNPGTCAPRTDCADGIDNALGVLAAVANAPIQDAVNAGSLHLVMDFDSLTRSPFALSLFPSELAPDSESCDFVTSECNYLVGASTLDPGTCQPLITLPATRAGNRITAGGTGTIFPLDIPFGDGTLSLVLYSVRFEGTVTVAGGRVTALDGILGGAVPKEQLLAAINAIPEESLPLPKPTIVNLLNALVSNDIDTNGDGVLDAASIGIRLQAVSAVIVGVDE